MNHLVYKPPILWLAELGAWAMVGLPNLGLLLRGQVSSITLLWSLLWLVFGLVYTLGAVWRRGDRSRQLFLYGVLLVVVGLAAVVSARFDRTGVLFILTAALVGYVLPIRLAIGILVAQNLFFYIFAARQQTTEEPLVLAVIFLGFQIVILMSNVLLWRERQAREEVQRLNAELQSTQQLLAESSRLNERTRIARELHDALGHQLTALSLQLQVVGHMVQGEAREQLHSAQDITRDLLGDVREVVNTLREQPYLDVRKAIEALTLHIPSPKIHISLPSELKNEDPERAHALLRCMQEIVTNTVRHAGAQNLWIALENSPEGITVKARDDGRGVKDLHLGHGLRGMQERLEALGGSLEILPSTPRGFALSVFIPLNRRTP